MSSVALTLLCLAPSSAQADPEATPAADKEMEGEEEASAEAEGSYLTKCTEEVGALPKGWETFDYDVF